MHYLVIDKGRCRYPRCGDCEAVIPGLVAGFEKNGPLLFSEESLAAHRVALEQAINACRTGALTLKGGG